MYAQMMVKVGHLRPAVMAMVLRLEGSQADTRHHSSDVCCRGGRTDMLFSWANFRFWTPLLTLPKYSKVWKLVINLSVL